MKLSNKILIGFFGGGMLYMLSAFTEVRLRGDYRRLDGDNTKTETIELSNVRYLIVNDLDKRVTIRTSNTPRIELKSIDGDVLKGLKYNVAGDTLMLESFELEEDVRFSLNLYLPEYSVQQMEINEGSAYLLNVNLKSLTINQTGGRFIMQENVSVEKIDITASNEADMDMYNVDTDSVSLDADDSYVSLQFRIRHLKGEIKNGTRLTAQSVDVIEFKKDKSSSFRLLDY